MSKTIRCDRCQRSYQGSGEWNAVLAAGVITGYLCPACQTTDENAEAVIYESTIDYTVDSEGRYRGRSREER
jgi:hypothetical protein